MRAPTSRWRGSGSSARRLRSSVAGIAVLALVVGALAACTTVAYPSAASDGASAAASPPGTTPVSQSGVAAVPDRTWWLPKNRIADDSELAAFADRVSVTAGEPVRLFVSSSAPYVTITAYRVGDARGTGATRVWTSARVPTRVQRRARVEGDTRTVVARWSPTTTVPTSGWPDGLYALRLVRPDGRGRYVPLVVRTTDLRGTVVVVAAVTTWQAYNAWGGRSLYHGPTGFSDRSYAVSFDRPYDGNGFGLPASFEAPVAAAAERSGVRLGWTTTIDLDAHPESLGGALGVVSTGHDEYWTQGYRSALVRARAAGTNLAFLGANAGYWRVRLAATGLGPRRLVVGYKSAAADPVRGEPNTTARWRDAPHAQPEETVTGQRYDCYPAHGDLVVRDPSFFLFAGTGAVRGSTYHGLIGIESDRAYPLRTTPRPLQVPALSPTRCGGGSRTWSTITYATFPSGAGVLAVGTMNWARALRGTSGSYGIGGREVTFVRAVTRTLLRAMFAGPMGRAHPARDDLGSLGLPAQNTTGSA